uniref:Uncharacterized protein n=1 Tax=Glossina palpalis gambiensis TaxID=67801 RepID=A0A1B0BRV6_9MUSC
MSSLTKVIFAKAIEVLSLNSYTGLFANIKRKCTKIVENMFKFRFLYAFCRYMYMYVRTLFVGLFVDVVGWFGCVVNLSTEILHALFKLIMFCGTVTILSFFKRLYASAIVLATSIAGVVTAATNIASLD